MSAIREAWILEGLGMVREKRSGKKFSESQTSQNDACVTREASHLGPRYGSKVNKHSACIDSIGRSDFDESILSIELHRRWVRLYQDASASDLAAEAY
jgi:hypothetical protein